MTKKPAAKRPVMPSSTYRDGVRGERCRTCHALLRDAGDAPMVSIRLADLERVAVYLAEVGGPAATAVIQRLEQAAGRTVAQMKADPR